MDFAGSTCLCLFSLLVCDQSSAHKIHFYFPALSIILGKQMPLRLGDKIKIIVEKDLELKSQRCPVLHLPVLAPVFTSNRRALPFSCVTYFMPPSRTLALLGLPKLTSSVHGAWLVGERRKAWGHVHKICEQFFFLLEIWDSSNGMQIMQGHKLRSKCSLNKFLADVSCQAVY